MKIAGWQKIPKLWKNISSGSINNRIFGAAVVVAMGTTLVKLLAIAKELVVASRFGTTQELDTYLIALTIPSFLLNIIAGSFNSALIPTYIKVREQKGIKAAQQLLAGATIWSVGLLTVGTLIMLAGAPVYLPQLIAGFSPEKLALTYRLLWAISPMLILTGIGTVWSAVLNAGERFALAALVQMVTPTVTVVFLFATPNWGVFDLVAGMVGGQLIEMTIIGTVLTRQGFSLRPKWYGFNADLQEVASQYLPAIVGTFLMCSTGLVDRSMAAMLPSGSVAALDYGGRMVTLPIIIASTALSTAVMPYFSKMVASDDWHGIRNSLKHYLMLIFAGSLPLTGFIIVFSEPIVRIMLQRGSFTADDTIVVAHIQSSFAIQVPFYIGCMLVVRLISAMRKNYILMIGSAFNLTINIGLNYLFMRWLGVAGIALSTSFVYVFSFFFLLAFVLRNLKKIDNLILTPDQKVQIAQTRQTKTERIKAVLTPEQRQIFQEIELQKAAQPQPDPIDVSTDDKAKLAKIRQQSMAKFKEILTPEQIVLLDRITGWEQGISVLQLRQLHLNTWQQEKIARLWKDEKQQMDAFVTPDRWEKVRAKQSRRKAIAFRWEKMNLTPEQDAEIQAIRQDRKRQLKVILTAEQQAKIERDRHKYQL
ncbi:lipid II flippase MurJ [Chamaesiphon sp. GL140_3_metabinner_50]|uniref:lipid II flippase MurJ n=1 Tax=Chamaesiphon sp. GL140_3_metabinner_50 TaxID=2970812 RepID=UPI0025F6B423|nr:lipid II flippase MurJ [Chamaesiphon sp. GL140_3_metabinner_50]